MKIYRSDANMKPSDKAILSIVQPPPKDGRQRRHLIEAGINGAMFGLVVCLVGIALLVYSIGGQG